jgi:SAM-dependent methyltransferase
MLYDILRELWKGKSVHKTVSNNFLRGYVLSGRVLDFGGGKKRWSYLRYLKKEGEPQILSADIDAKSGADIVVNLESDNIPAETSSFDMALAFNVLEHIYNSSHLLSEAYRILKPGGMMLGSVPFLLNVHPDPYDFFRYTDMALRRIFTAAGFGKIEIAAAGLGPWTAGFLQIETFLSRFLRPAVYFPAYFLDKIIAKFRPKIAERYPLAYVFKAEKTIDSGGYSV